MGTETCGLHTKQYYESEGIQTMATTTKRLRNGTLVMGAAALMLALAGCSGTPNGNGEAGSSKAKAEYVAEDLGFTDIIGVIAIDDNQVSVQSYLCKDSSIHTARAVNDSDKLGQMTGTGELDDSRTHITWSTEPSFASKKSESMTVTNDSVSYQGLTFVKRGSDNGKSFEANMSCKLP